MALTTIIGYVLALVGIALGAYLEHVTFSSLFGPSAFLIVVVGSIGATAISHSASDLKGFLKSVRYVFVNPKLDFPGYIEKLVELADKARKNGLLALQEDAEQADNLLLQRGLTMAIDGADQEKVRAAMEFISQKELEPFEQGSAVGNTAAGYMPTIGIVGTVMAMTAVMRNLDRPETLGPSIAVAFLATLYGLLFANLLAAPWGTRMSRVAAEFRSFHEMIITGVLAIQEGENPRNLREQLEIYLLHQRGKRTAAGQRDGG